MLIKCPNCGKSHEQPQADKAEMNVEAYGSQTFHFQCPKCKKMYALRFTRKVELTSITESWVAPENADVFVCS